MYKLLTSNIRYQEVWRRSQKYDTIDT